MSVRRCDDDRSDTRGREIDVIDKAASARQLQPARQIDVLEFSRKLRIIWLRQQGQKLVSHQGLLRKAHGFSFGSICADRSIIVTG